MANNKVPAFTRRDFQYIADVLKTIDFDCCADRQRCIAEFNDALRLTNPNFDSQRFITACTPNGGSGVKRG